MVDVGNGLTEFFEIWYDQLLGKDLVQKGRVGAPDAFEYPRLEKHVFKRLGDSILTQVPD